MKMAAVPATLFCYPQAAFHFSISRLRRTKSICVIARPLRVFV
jgi:hypothetical protein